MRVHNQDTAPIYDSGPDTQREIHKERKIEMLWSFPSYWRSRIAIYHNPRCPDLRKYVCNLKDNHRVSWCKSAQSVSCLRCRGYLHSDRDLLCNKHAAKMDGRIKLFAIIPRIKARTNTHTHAHICTHAPSLAYCITLWANVIRLLLSRLAPCFVQLFL